MNWWKRRRKIVSLPGAKLTPEVALARTLEKAQAGTIKSVYIGIEWDDGTYVGEWSNQMVSSLLIHARVAQREADKSLFTGASTGDSPAD